MTCCCCVETRMASHLHGVQVTLIYHKKLDDDWRAAAEKLRTALSEAPSSSEAAVTVIGRSHKQVLLVNV